MIATGTPLEAAQKSKDAVDVPDWVRKAAARPIQEATTDVVWLHEEEIVEPLAVGGVRKTRRLVGRVMTPAGLEDLGSHSVYYRRGDEIRRSQAWTTDLHNIIEAAKGWGQLSSGEWPLVIIARNALNFVKGTKLGDKLKILLEDMEDI
ncbi:MAG: hypothetical protein JSV80_03955, partial [Acidobacteriota bacterium]